MKGYTEMEDGTCTQCLSGCDECQRDSLSSCLTCLQGTFLNKNRCENCPQGCISCISAKKC